MASRRILFFLLASAVVLLVAFLVIGGTALVLGASGDRGAAKILSYVGLGCLLGFAIDLVCLVLVLAAQRIAPDERPGDPTNRP